MRLRAFAVFVVALLIAGPALAQEQRGAIEGVVKDASGAVLPGAMVECKAATGVVLSTTSDSVGFYRFPALSSGSYDVTASLANFQSRTVAEVRVALGQIKKVDFALPLATVTETVQVTAVSPIVDVRQSARQLNIKTEQVTLLPHGRDFTSLVVQAPGANNEAKLGGLSIDGASAGENRYIIDGVETTNLRTGTSSTSRLITDFVEEVQVKSSGYSAEYGGAMGGVVNAVTKSGTNDFSGSVIFNYQGSNLRGGNRPTLRRNLVDDNIAEYITYPKDDEQRMEPGFSLGGPIQRNRIWFFGAYLPVFETTERTVNPGTAANPSANTITEDQKTPVQNFTGNISSQLSNNVRFRWAYNNAWRKDDGLLPALTGTDPAGTNYTKTSTFPNWSTSGNLDWVVSPKLFFGARVGYALANQHDANVTEEPRVLFSTGNNLGFPEVPASLRRSSGFSSIPTNSKVTRDQFTRMYFQADGTWYAHAGGTHQVKFGVQYDRLGNDVLLGESRNLVRIHWNTALSSGRPVTRGTYGYYQVRSNGVLPKQGFITEGNIHMNVIGLFVQDAWTINEKLTLNLGIRTEQEKVPTYASGADIPQFGIEFPFSQKIAPRVGAAYDVFGDGNWKVFGSWGIFYDIFKLELPRGSFGGDKWLEYYYTLDTFDWTSLVSGANCPPQCSGTLIRGPIDFRHPSFGSDAIDPDLKPMQSQEASAGIEHQFNDRWAGSVKWVHKRVIRAIEDTGALDADGNEIYIIANPGEGLTELANISPRVNLPKPKREYDSVEFAADKRYSDRWFLRMSYMWSRLYGNYSGLSQSDENGRTSPNVGRLWDYPLMMFQDGGRAAYGPLATDRPHQFKTQLIYGFDWGTSVGINEFVASGLPVSREIGVYPPNNLPVQYLGRGSDGRTPVFSQTDLLVQHTFDLQNNRSVQVAFNVLNLFNQDTAVSKNSTYHKTNGVTPNETLFYQGQQTLASLITSQNVVRNPLFLMNNSFQAPLQARIDLRFIF
jgi:hypothetical protein